MSGQHSKRNQSGKAKATARRRRRAIGLGGGAGAFLAFGTGPLAGAPTANADVLDSILDPIINSLASIDPTLGADVSGLVTAFDPTFVGDPAAVALPAADSALPAADSAQALSLAGQYNVLYLANHAFDQQWIDGTTFLGQSTVTFDNFINSLSPGTLLIGNGAMGTEADPTGGAGGLFFGDGGTGWDSDIAGDNGFNRSIRNAVAVGPSVEFCFFDGYAHVVIELPLRSV